MTGTDQPVLTAWCAFHLGSHIDRVLFRRGYFSDVTGVVLQDGTRVVVKIRPAAPRLASCAQVQTTLFVGGFPVPELLVAPTAYGEGRAASAEALVEEPAGTGSVEASAALLAEQVRLSPALATGALDPAPAWVRWHHDEQGLWPTPDDREVDLNSRRIEWIDAPAGWLRRALIASGDDTVVGHADWVRQNVWWNDDDTRLVVHDWDSLAALPEPAVAGVAAAIYADNATVDDTAAFLEAYQRATTRWTPQDARTAWAAGLWTRLFDAKKDLLAGRSSTLDEQHVRLRMFRAGL